MPCYEVDGECICDPDPICPATPTCSPAEACASGEAFGPSLTDTGVSSSPASDVPFYSPMPPEDFLPLPNRPCDIEGQDDGSEVDPCPAVNVQPRGPAVSDMPVDRGPPPSMWADDISPEDREYMAKSAECERIATLALSAPQMTYSICMGQSEPGTNPHGPEEEPWVPYVPDPPVPYYGPAR